MSKLSIILPVAFGVFAAGSVAALDFYKRSLVAGPDGYSVSTYIEEVKEEYSARAKEVVANRKLKDHLGVAPEGWEKREFDRADISIMTGEPLEEPKEQDDGLTKGQRAIMAVAAGAATRGSQAHAYTYQKDDSLVIVQATFLPARIMKGFGGKQMGMMVDMMKMANMEKDFAIVRGLKFGESSYGHNDEHYKKYVAGIGQQVQLTVLSNADEKDVISVLETLDIAAMNQMLADPVPQMGEIDLVMLASEAEAEKAAQYAAATKKADLYAAERAKDLADAIARDARTQKGVEGESEDQAALEASLSPAGAEQSSSIIDRLQGFLRGGSAKKDEGPRRMVCTIQKGFKRCVFPEE